MRKINKYTYIFIAFVVVTIAAFTAFRYAGAQSSVTALSEAEAAPAAQGDDVIVTKNPELAEMKQKLLKDTSGDYYLGNQYAPVVIIEYASLSCPHCAHFHENVVGPITPDYIDKGKVKYVFRDYPLDVTALSAAKLAHCADPDKFFSFIKVLFKSQDQWAHSDNYLATLKSIAKLGGMTPEKFDQCQKDKAIEDKIIKSAKDALEILDVQSTPTVFINGNKYTGAPDFKDVSEYINKLLKGE